MNTTIEKIELAEESVTVSVHRALEYVIEAVKDLHSAIEEVRDSIASLSAFVEDLQPSIDSEAMEVSDDELARATQLVMELRKMVEAEENDDSWEETSGLEEDEEEEC